MTNTLFVMLIISKFHPSRIRRFIETPAGRQATADRRPAALNISMFLQRDFVRFILGLVMGNFILPYPSEEV